MEERNLEFSDGKSNKFWTIKLEETQHTVHYGRIGSKGVSSSKQFDTPEEAKKSYDKLVAKKLKKGYQDASSLEKTEPVAPPEDTPTRSPLEIAAKIVSELAPDARPVAESTQPLQKSEEPATKLHWDTKTRKLVHPRRNTPVKPPKYDKETTRLALLKEFDKFREGFHNIEPIRGGIDPTQSRSMVRRVEASLRQPDDSPFDAGLEAFRGAMFGVNSPGPGKDDWCPWVKPSHLIGYWVSHFGPGPALAALWNAFTLDCHCHRAACTFEPRRPSRRAPEFTVDKLPCFAELRKALAGVSLLDYQVARMAASQLRDKDTTARRRMLSYLFPDEQGWCEEDMATLSQFTPEPRWVLLACTESLSTVENLLEQAVQQEWQEEVAPYTYTLVEQFGDDVVSPLVKLLASQRRAPWRKSVARALSIIESEQVGAFFAKALSDADLGDTARAFFQVFPHLAQGKAKRVVPTQKSEVGEEAGSEQVPDCLQQPPWKRKPRQAEVVLNLEPLPWTDSIRWAPGDREHAQEALTRARRRYIGGELNGKYDQLNTDSPFAQESPEAALKQWNTQIDGDKTSKIDGYEGSAILAWFGVQAIPGALQFGRSNYCPMDYWRSLCTPKVAYRAAYDFGTKGVQTHMSVSARPQAARWLLINSRAAAVGLIPTAVGEPGTARDLALTSLRYLVARGRREIVKEVAKEYGDETFESLESSVFDLLQLGPKKPKKLPPFWQPENWARPRINGRLLSLDHTKVLGQLLAFSPTDPPYQGLVEIRECCDQTSLDEFAHDLFMAWYNNGAKPAQKWAFHAMGHLGGAQCIHQLIPLISRWQREKRQALVATAVEVLVLTGSELALSTLSGLSRKAAKAKTKRLAAGGLERVSLYRGLTLEELEDRCAPTLDLDRGGRKLLDLGGRCLQATLSSGFEPLLQDAEGHQLKRFPKTEPGDDAAKVKEAKAWWKTFGKSAKAVLEEQAQRLELAMGWRRRWSLEAFRELLVEHPLMSLLTRSLLWGSYDAHGALQTAFRVAEDHTFADLQDERLELSPESRVGLVHPLELRADEGWESIFSDYEIVPPFPQLSRPLRELRPEEATARQIDDHNGIEVEPGVLLGLLKKGWTLYVDDTGNFRELEKQLPNRKWAKVWFNTGINPRKAAESGPQTLESIKFDCELAEVDPVMLSEICLEIGQLSPTSALL